VRLYSILRHRPGGDIVSNLDVDLPPGATVAQVRRLLQVPPDLEVIVAVNGDIAGEDTPLSDGDRLSLIPSIAGGAASIAGGAASIAGGGAPEPA
jgi:molybdopterin converting factor small subunit